MKVIKTIEIFEMLRYNAEIIKKNSFGLPIDIIGTFTMLPLTRLILKEIKKDAVLHMSRL